MSLFQNISPSDLHRRLQSGESFRIIDVREQPEWEVARIEGAELKPLSLFNQWKDDFDAEGGPYVLHCHHGVRSMQACSVLGKLGVKNLFNLTGGIDQWSRDVDADVPIY